MPELVLRGKITGAGQRAFLSALLEDGYEAVTIRVDDVPAIAGMVMRVHLWRRFLTNESRKYRKYRSHLS